MRPKNGDEARAAHGKHPFCTMDAAEVEQFKAAGRAGDLDKLRRLTASRAPRNDGFKEVGELLGHALGAALCCGNKSAFDWLMQDPRTKLGSVILDSVAVCSESRFLAIVLRDSRFRWRSEMAETVLEKAIFAGNKENFELVLQSGRPYVGAQLFRRLLRRETSGNFLMRLFSEGLISKELLDDGPALKVAFEARNIAASKLLLQDTRVDPSFDDNWLARVFCGEVFGYRFTFAPDNHAEFFEALLRRLDPTQLDIDMLSMAFAKSQRRIFSLLISDPRIEVNGILAETVAKSDPFWFYSLISTGKVTDASANDNEALIRLMKTCGKTNHADVAKKLNILCDLPGFDVCARNNFAIKHAIAYGTLEIVYLLLEKGAKPKGADIDSLLRDPSMSDRRTRKERRELLVLLMDHGLDPSFADNFLIRHFASIWNLSSIKKFLVHPRVDPSACESEALRNAVDHQKCENALLILEDPRVDPSVHDNRCIKNVDARVPGGAELTRRLLADERVNPAAGSQQPLLDAIHRMDTTKAGLLLQDERVSCNKMCLNAASTTSTDLLRVLLPHISSSKQMTLLRKSFERRQDSIVVFVLEKIRQRSALDMSAEELSEMFRISCVQPMQKTAETLAELTSVQELFVSDAHFLQQTFRCGTIQIAVRFASQDSIEEFVRKHHAQLSAPLAFALKPYRVQFRESLMALCENLEEMRLQSLVHGVRIALMLQEKFHHSVAAVIVSMLVPEVCRDAVHSNVKSSMAAAIIDRVTCAIISARERN